MLEYYYFTLTISSFQEVTKQSNKLNEDRHNLNNNSQKVGIFVFAHFISNSISVIAFFSE